MHVIPRRRFRLATLAALAIAVSVTALYAANRPVVHDQINAWQEERAEAKQARKQTAIEELEQKILALVNAERGRSGASALKPDTRLQMIARAHSQYMADERFFSHYTRTGLDPTARAREAGYNCGNGTYGVAENLYLGSGEEAVSGWLTSLGHRFAMLERSFTRGGVGVHEGLAPLPDNGPVDYVTLLLC